MSRSRLPPRRLAGKRNGLERDACLGSTIVNVESKVTVLVPYRPLTPHPAPAGRPLPWGEGRGQGAFVTFSGSFTLVGTALAAQRASARNSTGPGTGWEPGTGPQPGGGGQQCGMNPDPEGGRGVHALDSALHCKQIESARPPRTNPVSAPRPPSFGPLGTEPGCNFGIGVKKS